MAKYASNTTVGVDRSLGEIRATLRRFGATGFGYVEQEGTAVIAFEKDGRHYRFVLPLPKREQYRYARVNASAFQRERSEAQITLAHEQGIAEKWRALSLAIKGIVVAIDEGILTFEQAFFSNVIVPGEDRTVYDVVQPQVEAAYQGQRQPLQLAAPAVPTQVHIAEVVDAPDPR